MSLCGSFLSEEQFQCSICLEVFTNPSTTPCGHSFCMACISKYWDGLKVFQCPLCKKTFQKRPDLHINRTLREITEQFRSMQGGGSVGRAKQGRRGGGALPCGVFDELKKKLHQPLTKPPHTALTCDSNQAMSPKVTTLLASSVPNHSPIAAMSHNFGPPPPPPFFCPSSRRRFTLSGAANSHILPVCDIHNRGILIYCRTDQVCICPDCATEDHQDHDMVTVEDEWMETTAQLRVSEQEIQEMIRQRVRKIEEIRMAVTAVEVAVERETAGSIRLFSALRSAIERSQAELIEVMEMSKSAAEHQANAMIRQLELEVEELRTRETVLSQLAQSDDHMHCVKTFPIFLNPPPAKDWTGVSLNSELGTEAVYRSLTALLESFQDELKNIAETGFPVSVMDLSRVRTQPRMKRVQECALDVTLDSNTAHPRLILSVDMKSVRCLDRHQMLPGNPERFDKVICVLGREAISSGRHYWEVEVSGKTDWDLGVARQSVSRKGKIEATPSNGYWFLSLRDKNKYTFPTESSKDVYLNLHPHKIGIFVDFEKGQVSFYNVEAKIHIYTFNDTFTECIYPFFSPSTNKLGKNDGPLIITPVTITD